MKKSYSEFLEMFGYQEGQKYWGGSQHMMFCASLYLKYEKLEEEEAIKFFIEACEIIGKEIDYPIPIY